MPPFCREGQVSKFPRFVVGVHVQHHQPIPGGNGHIVRSAVPPPLGKLVGGCVRVPASVQGGRFLSITGEYPQARAGIALRVR